MEAGAPKDIRKEKLVELLKTFYPGYEWDYERLFPANRKPKNPGKRPNLFIFLFFFPLLLTVFKRL